MLFLMIFSAFFSGMEAAVFSISKFRIKTLLFENKRGARELSRIKEDPGKTLSTLLLLNNLVNIGASSVATIIISQILLRYQLAPSFYYILEIFLMTFVLLLFGEITPKTIFLNNAEFFGLNLSFAVGFLNKLTKPFTRATSKIMHMILPAKKGMDIGEEDIRKMLAEAKKLKILDETEEQLGYRMLKFGRILVKEIMVPACNVVGLVLSKNVEDAMEIIRKTGHSRICVFEDTNKVIGVLYAKDLILNSSSRKQQISELVRKPFFILNTKPIDELLVEFRKKGVHFAVVRDQHENFLGIVTLNDVLKYLFGDIPGL
ncbi:MAG: hemolysin family protein [candidate division WOR-3 bacterium]